MPSKPIPTVDVQVSHPKNRAATVPFKLTSNNVTTLLIEVVQLVKLTKSLAADLEKIRLDHAHRTQHMKDVHTEVMFMIEHEYADRSQQMLLIQENVKLLIQAQQYELATQITHRLADILAESPLKKALEFRSQREG